MYTTQGISAAPVVLHDVVYAGGNDGRVWALTGGRDALWNLPGSAFQTGGKISADLVVDEAGVYVASQDKQLYCLDRTSGKIRWSYYAPSPLLESPYVSATHAYQFVPHVGLVAIDKTQGGQARTPVWVQPLARQVLSVDDKYVYVSAGGSILALDKATGDPIFRSQRTDMTAFAVNMKDSTIYAATRVGTIMAVKPVLKPGTVGEIVSNELLFEPVAMAGK
jgi:outer membrane protein assembly factor BamB